MCVRFNTRRPFHERSICRVYGASMDALREIDVNREGWECSLDGQGAECLDSFLSLVLCTVEVERGDDRTDVFLRYVAAVELPELPEGWTI
jgi:hypothetical protein